MSYNQWSQGDVARAYLIRDELYIDEILVMANSPDFPDKLQGGYIERSICPLYSDGLEIPRVFKKMAWVNIESVDNGLNMARKLGFVVEYAPGCGPESRKLGCSLDCGGNKTFGGCVDG